MLWNLLAMTCAQGSKLFYWWSCTTILPLPSLSLHGLIWPTFRPCFFPLSLRLPVPRPSSIKQMFVRARWRGAGKREGYNYNMHYSVLMENLLQCHTGLFIRSWEMFCKMYSDSSPCLVGQHSSCRTAPRPLELSENIKQNHSHGLMNNPVYSACTCKVHGCKVIPDARSDFAWSQLLVGA